jgi:N-acetyl-alpha-D-muramate 1-phosphate uridylyltransferase
MLPVAILAGGLATRLRPLTDRVPKSLLAIAGRPFIFHQLELLKNQGVDRVVLCVGHLGDQIKAAVGNGRDLGLSIQYSFDGNELPGTGDGLLGTGGAIKKALPLLGDHFFVLNGDSYLTCSFAMIQAAYDAAGRPALMTVLRNDNRWDRSNVLFRNGEVIEYDKTSQRSDLSHIDYGLSVLSRVALATRGEAGIIDLADIFRELANQGQLAAIEVAERFYEVGSTQGITETGEFLSLRLADA